MSNLSANAQPFVPVTTPAATTITATRVLIANPQPLIMVPIAPVQLHAGIWWMTVPFFDFMDDDDYTGERSLFMTFSNGSPLTKEEISDYFNKFGLCVDTVYVKNEQHRDPEYGKVTFLPSFLAEKLVLRNRKVVKISVNKKPIWLKKYVPRNQRRMMAARMFV